ncbi:MAG: GHKL domain-containing protein [Lachnospiraceae bacterium]|nr:GHKL domain-containing protein [Lachnospiraceae bacterium]
MTKELYVFLLFTIEYLKIFLIIRGGIFFTFKNQLKRTSAIFVLVSLIVISLSYVMEVDKAITFGMYLSVLVTLSLFNNFWIRGVILHIVTGIMSSLLNVYTISIFELCSLNRVFRFSSVEHITLFCNSLLIPFLIIIYVFNKIVNKEQYIEDFSNVWTQYIVLIVGMVCCYMVIKSSQILLFGISGNNLKLKMFIIINSSCVVFFIISLWQIRTMSSRNYYKSRDIYQRNYIDVQEENFRKTLENENQLRSFRHDLRAHMIAIQEMAEKGDYGNLVEYTSSILDKVESLKNIKYSGNIIVDAVVTDIVKQYERENIELIWEGHIPYEVDIDRMDLCTIISNVVKNAFEAAMKIKNPEYRKIYISVGVFEGKILFHEHNYISKDIIMVNNRPYTDKNDKRAHGYGTANIERCAEKYNGTVKYDVDGKIFSIDIIVHPKSNC